jgi:site-specific recombinase XerD
VLFPSAKGERLSVHGVQYLLNKHRMTASNVCPSLKHKRVTVHRLRHYAGFRTMPGEAIFAASNNRLLQFHPA